MDKVGRVDQCCTFGIKKTSSKSLQYQPYLFINSQQLPPVKINDSFSYLGKSFNFDMNVHEIRAAVEEKIERYLSLIETIPVKNIDKIKILNTYVFSKLRWPMSIYDLGTTWVKQSCDNLITRSIRRWLDIHPGTNVSHLKLPAGKLGLNVQLNCHRKYTFRVKLRKDVF